MTGNKESRRTSPLWRECIDCTGKLGSVDLVDKMDIGAAHRGIGETRWWNEEKRRIQNLGERTLALIRECIAFTEKSSSVDLVDMAIILVARLGFGETLSTKWNEEMMDKRTRTKTSLVLTRECITCTAMLGLVGLVACGMICLVRIPRDSGMKREEKMIRRSLTVWRIIVRRKGAALCTQSSSLVEDQAVACHGRWTTLSII